MIGKIKTKVKVKVKIRSPQKWPSKIVDIEIAWPYTDSVWMSFCYLKF
ncbi:hypothetical protein HanIR_Chr08g0366281 [Helianthus annuus]|nr:hypothetical protein HanIR_Chr08g0366281 [Helianthus annuus]